MTRSLRLRGCHAAGVALAYALGAVPTALALPPGDGLREHVSYAAPDRATMYEMVRAHYASELSLAVAPSAAAIPAFARKYGMKCAACHNAVPELNNFGRAFRDKGYRMSNGNDDLRLNNPSYWPVFAWLWKGYDLSTDRVGGKTVQQNGHIADGAGVFGMLGSISDRVSVRYMPQIYEDGRSFVDAGWIRYNRAFGTDWLNVKVGSPEFDLPLHCALARRPENLSVARPQSS